MTKVLAFLTLLTMVACGKEQVLDGTALGQSERLVPLLLQTTDLPSGFSADYSRPPRFERSLCNEISPFMTTTHDVRGAMGSYRSSVGSFNEIVLSLRASSSAVRAWSNFRKLLHSCSAYEQPNGAQIQVTVSNEDQSNLVYLLRNSFRGTESSIVVMVARENQYVVQLVWFGETRDEKTGNELLEQVMPSALADLRVNAPSSVP